MSYILLYGWNYAIENDPSIIISYIRVYLYEVNKHIYVIILIPTVGLITSFKYQIFFSC